MEAMMYANYKKQYYVGSNKTDEEKEREREEIKEKFKKTYGISDEVYEKNFGNS